MFQTASPTFARNLLLGAVLVGALAVASVAGAAWYVSRCDARDYLQRAAASPLNPNEQFLFACRYLWRSAGDGIWTRYAVRGLPFGARDGYIAVDRKFGQLYLGIVIPDRSWLACWQCAWSRQRPAIYVSSDGGQNWSFAYRFKRGQAGLNNFMALFADPIREDAVYAVIRNGDEITYYGSGTAGQFWKPMCREFSFVGSGGCRLPTSVLQAQFQSPAGGGVIGD